MLGAVLPLTGTLASFGEACAAGMRVGVQRVNAAGGVHGAPLELVVLDSHGQADRAIDAANVLLDDHHPVIVLGEVASAVTMAIGPVVATGGGVLLAPVATHPGILEGGDTVFALAAFDRRQGEVAAAWSLAQGWRRAGVLIDGGIAYSTTLAEAFVEAFVAGGGVVVAREAYVGSGLAGAVAVIGRARPEVIFAPGFYADGAAVLKEARAAGFTMPVLGGDGWDSPELAGLAGAAAEGALFVNHFAPDDPEPATAAFVAAWRAEHETLPDGIAALGHDAILVAADALQRASSRDPAGIAAALRATDLTTLATGPVRYAGERAPLRSMVILRVTGGVPRYVTRVLP